MSAAKHTPGPWAVYETTDRYPGVEADKANQSIVIYGHDDEQCGVRGKTYDESIANARLIAAAPELLELIRLSIGNVRSLGPAGALAQVQTPYQEWLAQLEAVYTKATGEAA